MNDDKITEAKPEFLTLVEQHGRELYAYLWRMLQDRQDAEDCLQDTYLRAYRAYDRTSAGWNYRAWLYKIALNVARDLLKRKRRSEDFKHDANELPQDGPLASVAHKEQVRRVLSAMSGISYRQRSAIIMRKYNELDYDDIAQALVCSPETARAHVYQGLKRLRERLGATESEGNAHG